MDNLSQEQISLILDKKYKYIKDSFMNLGVSERIVRGRMPTLEMCSERFVRFLRPDLFSSFHNTFDLSFGGISELKYKDYMYSLSFPSSLNIVKIKPLQGFALINIEYKLLFYLVDLFFGGDCSSAARDSSKEFTSAEKRVTSILLDLFFSSYKKSWENVLDIDLEYSETEINPMMTNIAGLSDYLVISKFHLSFDNIDGYFHICLPHGTIEPIRDILSARVQTGFVDSDDRWGMVLFDELKHINLNVQAFLTSFDLTVDQVMNISEGDVLYFDMPDKAVVYLEDIPSFLGTIGSHNHSTCVQLDSIVEKPRDFKRNIFKGGAES